MAERFDRIWHHARLVTMRQDMPDLGVIEDALVAVRDGRIAFAGARADFPSTADAAERIDCEGRWITPGLVDCHTHLVYGGNRAHEFELRLKGASYEEIARSGGGIVSTVAATRHASEADLVAGALPRLDALIGEGVTTIEIKSGYGLNTDTEMRQLQAARNLGRGRLVAVRTSFLGAHALPPEAEGDKDRYIDRVCREMLPAVARAGLADAVDAFMEGIAFSRAQTARVFAAARALGLPVKLHADQLSNLGGAALAAEFSALSADHLEHTDDAGVAAMAKAGTVAVLLPGAFYFIRETQKPPVELFRAQGVNMALATDCNPGSSPLTSPLLTMNMGATLFRMTVAECLLGVTREGARALGLLAEAGTLEAAKWCDLAIWDIERPAELVYRIGFNPLHSRVWRGR
jgi:imidazolonepropionase